MQQTTLTPKQARFCAEYFIDMNATKAAIRAGYSEKTAANGKLMSNPEIKAYLQERGMQLNDELAVTQHELLVELKKIAFAQMGDCFNPDGTLKPISEFGENEKAALWNLSITEKKGDTTTKLRMHNKLSAIEKIAKHIGFYKPLVRVSGEGGMVNSADTEQSGPVVRAQSVIRVEGERYGRTVSSPGKYGNDDPEHELDIESWMADAANLASYETEKRLKAEFAQQMAEMERKLQQAEAKLAQMGISTAPVAQESQTKLLQAATTGTEKAIADEKNTDKYPYPPVEEVITYRVGDYTAEGHLIYQDGVRRDKKSTLYDPTLGFYYIRKVGGFGYEKVYLPVKKVVHTGEMQPA